MFNTSRPWLFVGVPLLLVLATALGSALTYDFINRNHWNATAYPNQFTGAPATPVARHAQLSLTHQLSMSSSISHSDAAPVLTGEALIVASEEFSEAVAKSLKSQLEGHLFPKVDIRALADLPREGTPLPPVIICLSDADVQRSPLYGNAQLVVQLGIHLGHELGSDNYSITTDLTPRVISIACRGHLTSQGIELPGTERQVEESVAKELVTKIKEFFQNLSHDHFRQDRLDPLFYPPFVEPPAWEFLNSLGAKVLLRGTSPLACTDVSWEIESDSPIVVALETIARELATQGWRVPSSDLLASSKNATFQHSLGSQKLSVYPLYETQASNGGPGRYVIRYARHLDKDQQVAVAQQLLARPKFSPDVLLLAHHLTSEELAGLAQMIASKGPASPQLWYQLAVQLKIRQMTDEARRALQISSVLYLIQSPGQPRPKSWEATAKDLAPTGFSQVISEDHWRAAGVLDARSTADVPPPVIIPSTASVSFLFPSSADEQRFITLQTSQQQAAANQWGGSVTDLRFKISTPSSAGASENSLQVSPSYSTSTRGIGQVGPGQPLLFPLEDSPWTLQLEVIGTDDQRRLQVTIAPK